MTLKQHKLTALLPCPFCGAPAAYLRGRNAIACTSCLAEGPVTTPEGITEMWNTRHQASIPLNEEATDVDTLINQKLVLKQYAEAATEALEQSQKRERELVALLKRIEPYIDSIVCYASTMGEHEPNQIVFDVRKAIDSVSNGQG